MRYQSIRVPFRTALVRDIFQKKIDELFSNMSNVIGITDDILIAGFDEWGRDYRKMVGKVL